MPYNIYMVTVEVVFGPCNPDISVLSNPSRLDDFVNGFHSLRRLLPLGTYYPKELKLHGVSMKLVVNPDGTCVLSDRRQIVRNRHGEHGEEIRQIVTVLQEKRLQPNESDSVIVPQAESGVPSVVYVRCLEGPNPDQPTTHYRRIW